MYITQEIADRIKKVAKTKCVSMKYLLSNCELNINTISQFAKGQQLSCISLAKIADRLDCSVDYLLGRTDDSQSHKHSQPAVLVDNQPRFLIRRAGRDGSFVEEYVTKEDLERLHALPDAKDI